LVFTGNRELTSARVSGRDKAPQACRGSGSELEKRALKKLDGLEKSLTASGAVTKVRLPTLQDTYIGAMQGQRDKSPLSIASPNAAL
jgi:hypothetical protein